MHSAAFEFVRKFSTHDAIDIIEIGSRDINGTVRPFFPLANYIGLDLYAGPCVDVVCDAEQYQPDSLVDLVICTEVLEHAPTWRELIRVGASWLKPDGRMIITCAGPGRSPHSHHDGGALREGEYYANLSPEAVKTAMISAGLGWIEAEQVGEDTQAIGWKIARH